MIKSNEQRRSEQKWNIEATKKRQKSFQSVFKAENGRQKKVEKRFAKQKEPKCVKSSLQILANSFSRKLTTKLFGSPLDDGTGRFGIAVLGKHHEGITNCLAFLLRFLDSFAVIVDTVKFEELNSILSNIQK